MLAFSQVLSAIEQERLLSPIEVLRELTSERAVGTCTSSLAHATAHATTKIAAPTTAPTAPATTPTLSHVPLSVIYDLLERQLRTVEATSTEQMREAARFDDDVSKMRAEMAEIDGVGRVFQQSKCSSCHGLLEPPAVHFQCQHSFHLACLGDHDHECAICAPQQRRVAEHQQQQRALARGQEEFFRALEASNDPFATIAEFLGRGFLCTANQA